MCEVYSYYIKLKSCLSVYLLHDTANSITKAHIDMELNKIKRSSSGNSKFAVTNHNVLLFILCKVLKVLM